MAGDGEGLPTLGVEEEYFLVDPVTQRVRPAGDEVVAAAAAAGHGSTVTGEFTLYQVEGRTRPCTGLAELRADLAAVRRAAAEAARAAGVRLCASGTPVLGRAAPDAVGDHPRYRAGQAQYRGMIEDFGICAQHVHVHCSDREQAVLVGNHLRPWLPTLVALSANSPYHQGRSTGYASWRSVMRLRFPCLGPPPYAASLAEWERTARVIAAAEAMLDPAMPFWDVRPNPKLPTVEIRCMDVVAELDDAVALAALVRALVRVSVQAVRGGDPGPPVAAEEVRAAYWKAARDGVAGTGVDLRDGRVRTAGELAFQLLEHAREPLEEAGELGFVRARIAGIVGAAGAPAAGIPGRGGAEAQRLAAAGPDGLKGAVRWLVETTRRPGGEEAGEAGASPVTERLTDRRR
ncbi:carboxylate-amine ligase [Streptomyces purpureus]|uniref:Putative glutamate--cysteine ligase 2 n=1 Tax=Streptomyces purpureus TaxID=1951 RepID=A0A918GXT0_9ACTN|nr:YbdK family carboxylate-amine ligase [Streptomyces purpureus]GGT15645.1 putative glutamate--cysteine ligase 2 [Streptomyces purpureus]